MKNGLGVCVRMQSPSERCSCWRRETWWGHGPQPCWRWRGLVDLRWLMTYFGEKIATGLADGHVERVKGRDAQNGAWGLPRAIK